MAATTVCNLTLLLLVLLMGQAGAQRCADVDLGFILDSSGSISKIEHDEEKEFLKQIASHFKITINGSHEAVISFSANAELVIKLNDHKDQASFEAAVDRIPLTRGYTRIDKALRVAKDELFAESNGARKSVSKSLVILTDGSQTPVDGAEDPGEIADELREEGVNIVVVGIGTQTDPIELDHLAGGAGKSYRAATFECLLKSDFIEQVSTSTCPKKPNCTSLADIGFILDASGSLRRNYGREKEFLKQVAATFGISKDGFHSGVVRFAYLTELSIKFSDHYDQASFDKAVDDIGFDGGQTRLDKALKYADKELFAKENGARAHAAKYLVVITDGSQSPHDDAVDPGSIADVMREKGYNIIVLGVGPLTDPLELDHMSGKIGEAFWCTNFKALLEEGFVGKVQKDLHLCKDVAS